MTYKNRRTVKAMIAVVALALLTVLGSPALTASNTVPASQAGDGAGDITGYTVTAVSYDLNATNPTIIDEVTFTLDSAPETGSEIQVRLNSSSTDWYACTNVSAAVTCDTSGSPEITVVDADEPRVVAVD